MNQYEIFTTESDLNNKSTAIDVLLGYPNVTTETERYRVVSTIHGVIELCHFYLSSFWNHNSPSLYPFT